MPCYHPISAWQFTNVKTANGKPSISFQNPYADPSSDRLAIQLPCGQCIGCKLERSRQWAIRCVHEAYFHDDNAFITLTYDPKNIPPGGSLKKNDFQLFMKRLRRKIEPIKIRFFHCGEYGEKNNRPHYHACIFGYAFPDKILYSIRENVRLYRSPLLEEEWGLGFATVGDVTFESAAYVARYITKKITGDLAEKHYEGREPEYITMSRRPGIGSQWFNEFRSDVFPSDEVVLRGRVMRPPRFYDKMLEVSDPGLYKKIKVDRKNAALYNAADNSTARLKVKETCKLAQFKLLKRGLEKNET